MIIRPAIMKDLDTCLTLDHESVTDHVWQMKVQEADASVSVTFHATRLPRRMQATYPRALDQLTEHWQRGDGLFVAEVDGEVLGYIDVVAQRWQQMGWVTNLAVTDPFRRRGYGSALLRHARGWAKTQGLQTLVVEATTKNYPAMCLYQKLGFRFCGFSDHYYANQDIAVFFAQAIR